MKNTKDLLNELLNKNEELINIIKENSNYYVRNELIAFTQDSKHQLKSLREYVINDNHNTLDSIFEIRLNMVSKSIKRSKEGKYLTSFNIATKLYSDIEIDLIKYL